MSKTKTVLPRRLVKCPVEKIAIEVGELWDAFNGVEPEYGPVKRQLEEQRCALEELASHRRARSLGGAMFQLMLAKQEAGDLFSKLPEEEREENNFVNDAVERLLDSAMAAIRSAMGEDFERLTNVSRVYCGEAFEPMPWLDAIPTLAKAGRESVKQSKVGEG